MFIQRTQLKTKDKVYHSVLLMENYREGEKVKHRTITTLTKWPKHIVDDLDKLLKGKAIISIEATVTMDLWKGYRPLMQEYNISQIKSNNGLISS